MTSFDPVVDDYDAARPGYPDAVFNALEPLAGARVVDGGAGTGIATRSLRARGAHVVAVDIGEQMLRRNAGDRLVADGARLPLRSHIVDLVSFAQSWHWLDHELAGRELARVLVPGGRWAAWWSHPRADGEAWFEAYFELLEARTVARRTHRDHDWGATLDASAFAPPTFTSVPWVREVTIDGWLTDLRSHSYIGLAPGGASVLDDVEALLRDAFADGVVRCRYETWLWQSQVR